MMLLKAFFLFISCLLLSTSSSLADEPTSPFASYVYDIHGHSIEHSLTLSDLAQGAITLPAASKSLTIEFYNSFATICSLTGTDCIYNDNDNGRILECSFTTKADRYLDFHLIRDDSNDECDNTESHQVTISFEATDYSHYRDSYANDMSYAILGNFYFNDNREQSIPFPYGYEWYYIPYDIQDQETISLSLELVRDNNSTGLPLYNLCSGVFGDCVAKDGQRCPASELSSYCTASADGSSIHCADLLVSDVNHLFLYAVAADDFCADINTIARSFVIDAYFSKQGFDIFPYMYASSFHNDDYDPMSDVSVRVNTLTADHFHPVIMPIGTTMISGYPLVDYSGPADLSPLARNGFRLCQVWFEDIPCFMFEDGAWNCPITCTADNDGKADCDNRVDAYNGMIYFLAVHSSDSCPENISRQVISFVDGVSSQYDQCKDEGKNCFYASIYYQFETQPINDVITSYVRDVAENIIDRYDDYQFNSRYIFDASQYQSYDDVVIASTYTKTVYFSSTKYAFCDVETSAFTKNCWIADDRQSFYCKLDSRQDMTIDIKAITIEDNNYDVSDSNYHLRRCYGYKPLRYTSSFTFRLAPYQHSTAQMFGEGSYSFNSGYSMLSLENYITPIFYMTEKDSFNSPVRPTVLVNAYQYDQNVTYEVDYRTESVYITLDRTQRYGLYMCYASLAYLPRWSTASSFDAISGRRPSFYAPYTLSYIIYFVGDEEFCNDPYVPKFTQEFRVSFERPQLPVTFDLHYFNIADTEQTPSETKFSAFYPPNIDGVGADLEEIWRLPAQTKYMTLYPEFTEWTFFGYEDDFNQRYEYCYVYLGSNTCSFSNDENDSFGVVCPLTSKAEVTLTIIAAKKTDGCFYEDGSDNYNAYYFASVPFVWELSTGLGSENNPYAYFQGPHIVDMFKDNELLVPTPFDDNAELDLGNYFRSTVTMALETQSLTLSPVADSFIANRYYFCSTSSMNLPAGAECHVAAYNEIQCTGLDLDWPAAQRDQTYYVEVSGVSYEEFCDDDSITHYSSFMSIRWPRPLHYVYVNDFADSEYQLLAERIIIDSMVNGTSPDIDYEPIHLDDYIVPVSRRIKYLTGYPIIFSLLYKMCRVRYSASENDVSCTWDESGFWECDYKEQRNGLMWYYAVERSLDCEESLANNLYYVAATRYGFDAPLLDVDFDFTYINIHEQIATYGLQNNPPYIYNAYTRSSSNWIIPSTTRRMIVIPAIEYSDADQYTLCSVQYRLSSNALPEGVAEPICEIDEVSQQGFVCSYPEAQAIVGGRVSIRAIRYPDNDCSSPSAKVYHADLFINIGPNVQYPATMLPNILPGSVNLTYFNYDRIQLTATGTGVVNKGHSVNMITYDGYNMSMPTGTRYIDVITQNIPTWQYQICSATYAGSDCIVTALKDVVCPFSSLTDGLLSLRGTSIDRDCENDPRSIFYTTHIDVGPLPVLPYTFIQLYKDATERVVSFEPRNVNSTSYNAATTIYTIPSAAVYVEGTGVITEQFPFPYRLCSVTFTPLPTGSPISCSLTQSGHFFQCPVSLAIIQGFITFTGAAAFTTTRPCLVSTIPKQVSRVVYRRATSTYLSVSQLPSTYSFDLDVVDPFDVILPTHTELIVVDGDVREIVATEVLQGSSSLYQLCSVTLRNHACDLLFNNGANIISCDLASINRDASTSTMNIVTVPASSSCREPFAPRYTASLQVRLLPKLTPIAANIGTINLYNSYFGTTETVVAETTSVDYPTSYSLSWDYSSVTIPSNFALRRYQSLMESFEEVPSANVTICYIRSRAVCTQNTDSYTCDWSSKVSATTPSTFTVTISMSTSAELCLIAAAYSFDINFYIALPPTPVASTGIFTVFERLRLQNTYRTFDSVIDSSLYSSVYPFMLSSKTEHIMVEPSLSVHFTGDMFATTAAICSIQYNGQTCVMDEEENIFECSSLKSYEEGVATLLITLSTPTGRYGCLHPDRSLSVSVMKKAPAVEPIELLPASFSMNTYNESSSAYVFVSTDSVASISAGSTKLSISSSLYVDRYPEQSYQLTVCSFIVESVECTLSNDGYNFECDLTSSDLNDNVNWNTYIGAVAYDYSHQMSASARDAACFDETYRITNVQIKRLSYQAAFPYRILTGYITSRMYYNNSYPSTRNRYIGAESTELPFDTVIVGIGSSTYAVDDDYNGIGYFNVCSMSSTINGETTPCGYSYSYGAYYCDFHAFQTSEAFTAQISYIAGDSSNDCMNNQYVGVLNIEFTADRQVEQVTVNVSMVINQNIQTDPYYSPAPFSFTIGRGETNEFDNLFSTNSASLSVMQSSTLSTSENIYVCSASYKGQSCYLSVYDYKFNCDLDRSQERNNNGTLVITYVPSSYHYENYNLDAECLYPAYSLSFELYQEPTPEQPPAVLPLAQTISLAAIDSQSMILKTIVLEAGFSSSSSSSYVLPYATRTIIGNDKSLPWSYRICSVKYNDQECSSTPTSFRCNSITAPLLRTDQSSLYIEIVERNEDCSRYLAQRYVATVSFVGQAAYVNVNIDA